MDERSRWLIEPAELALLLAQTDLVILDGSWHLPPEGRDARAEFAAAHIPGAQFFDVDGIADTSSGLPHMLPTTEQFATAVGTMGIDNATDVVVYDTRGLFSAPRVWLTFRAFGHDRVRVLDGGLPRWRAEGYGVEGGVARSRAPRTFKARFTSCWVRDQEAVRAALAARNSVVVDARPAGRFAGRDPEPRPGLRAGHMPGAVNLPYSALLCDGRLKDNDGLAAAFAAAGVPAETPVIASCGSGMTAALVALARIAMGHNEVAIYDGSWAEWGKPDGPPVVTDG